MTMTRELRVQAGTQSDFVTAATPTVLLRGIETFDFQPGVNVVVLEDMSMGLAGGDTTVVNGIAGTASFEGWATYEQIPYYLDNLFGLATPVEVTAPFTRAYEAPITSVSSPRILSIVKGSGDGAYQFYGAVITNFTLTFTPGSEARFSGDMIGIKLQTDALESLAVPVVTPITGAHLGGFKMDAWNGTMGSTSLTSCDVRSVELTIETGRTADSCFGSLTPGSYTEDMWTSTLTLGLLWKGATKTAVDSYVGGTKVERQVEMTAASGSQSLKIQYAGSLMEDPTIFDDDEGKVMTTFTLTRQYHATFGNWIKLLHTSAIENLD
jgi:hypothetical protein